MLWSQLVYLLMCPTSAWTRQPSFGHMQVCRIIVADLIRGSRLVYSGNHEPPIIVNPALFDISVPMKPISRFIPTPGPIPGGEKPRPISGCIGSGSPMIPGLASHPVPTFPHSRQRLHAICKLAFRAGKNVPWFCMRAMGGSDARI